MKIVARAFATYHDNPEPQSAEEAKLIGEFLQNVTDCINVWNDIEPSDRIQAGFAMSQEITRLREAGLAMYVGVKKHVIGGSWSPPELRSIAYIIIRRGDSDETKVLVAF